MDFIQVLAQTLPFSIICFIICQLFKDRLGSCATLDCLVYGRIAGKNAAAFDIKD